MADKMRIDKWLWCVRIFKSRTQATDTCKEGKVKVNGVVMKASHEIQPGDILVVRKNGFDLQFKVVQLLPNRVGAPLAQAAYEDLTPADELNKYNSWYIGKNGVEKREKGAGRPTKKERREIDDYKNTRF